MFALNFQWPAHQQLLIDRQKNCTIRLGDIQAYYPENSVVRILVGKKFEAKKMLFTAIIDKVYIKKFFELTTADLGHQNPEIKSVDELITLFEKIYEKTVSPDDIVTVIYFSEITEL